MSVLRCRCCDAAVDSDYDVSGHVEDSGEYVCAECIEDGLCRDTDSDSRWPEGEDERLDDPRHGTADKKRP